MLTTFAHQRSAQITVQKEIRRHLCRLGVELLHDLLGAPPLTTTLAMPTLAMAALIVSSSAALLNIVLSSTGV